MEISHTIVLKALFHQRIRQLEYRAVEHQRDALTVLIVAEIHLCAYFHIGRKQFDSFDNGSVRCKGVGLAYTVVYGRDDALVGGEEIGNINRQVPLIFAFHFEGSYHGIGKVLMERWKYRVPFRYSEYKLALMYVHIDAVSREIKAKWFTLHLSRHSYPSITGLRQSGSQQIIMLKGFGTEFQQKLSLFGISAEHAFLPFHALYQFVIFRFFRVGGRRYGFCFTFFLFGRFLVRLRSGKYKHGDAKCRQ